MVNVPRENEFESNLALMWMSRCAEKDEQIAKLQAQVATLHRCLAANPDNANSTGAAQAMMEYQIELKDKRIEQLQARIEELEAQLAAEKQLVVDVANGDVLIQIIDPEED